VGLEVQLAHVAVFRLPALEQILEEFARRCRPDTRQPFQILAALEELDMIAGGTAAAIAPGTCRYDACLLLLLRRDRLLAGEKTAIERKQRKSGQANCISCGYQWR